MARPTPRMRLQSPTPSTPVTSRGGSPSPSPFASPSTPSKVAGPAENTYQRTFRAIIKNVTLIKSNWELLRGKWVDSAARVDKLKTAMKTRPSGINHAEAHKKQLKQARTLEDEQLYLFEQLNKMASQLEQLEKNSKKAEELLMEMSKRKGFEAAFADPLFLTWSPARFANALANHTSGYVAELIALEQATQNLLDDTEAVTLGLDRRESILPPPNTLLQLRRNEFMEICELELTSI